MKKITTKLSNLHKLLGVEEYEKEYYTDEEIFIENANGDYVKIQALVKKNTNMISCVIEGVNNPYVCAEKHLIATPSGWSFMIDAQEVLHKDGRVLKVLSKTKIGLQDSYDVGLDDPHTYCTENGLIHHNTFVVLYKALEEVLDKSNPFKKVIIVRSAVQGRDLGFTPGSVEEKMSLYEQPYHQICETLFGRKDAYQRLCEQDYIEFVSTSFLRGCTFDDAIVVVDECQSMTFHELSSIVTRVGYRSKIIFCGDTKQNDLIKNKHDVSGLSSFLKIADTMSEFHRIHFTPDDICRSSLVKSWIIACEKLDV